VNDVLHFWESLSFATQSDSGHTLHLPPGITWLGDPAFSYAMFMRPCYKTLYDLIAHSHRSIVLGTPGTGKTMFGLLVAWRHLKSSSAQPLIYHAQNDKLVLIVSGTAQHVEYKEVENMMLTVGSGAFYIVDANIPLAAVCRTLLISSPKKKVWSHWQRQYGPRVAYMPVPDLAELETCRSACYPSLPSERLSLLHEKWGGSFRLALAHASSECQAVAASQLNSDLSSKDLRKMLEVVAAVDSSGPHGVEDASHYVIHMFASTECMSFSLGFASPYMCSRALMASVLQGKNCRFHPSFKF
jgi:hypothetical protein